MGLSSLRNVLDKRLTANNTAAVSDRAESQFWKPQPDTPQDRAFNHTADELLFGGSAGGGKSALLLIVATTAQRRSAIFRREYPRLKDIIEKSHNILSGVARYNSNDKIWRDIPGDRTLEFGAIQHLKHLEAWRGREHDFKGFDELTEFTRNLYRFIITWCRSPIPNQRSRTIATSNPPTDKDGAWIIDYWSPWLKKDYPNPAESAESRYFVVLGVDRVDEFITQNPDAIAITPQAVTDAKERDVEVQVKRFRVAIGDRELTTDTPEPIEDKGLLYYPMAEKIAFGKELLEPRSRSFIPATLDDNAYLRNTSYRGTLQALPEPLRSQLLYGDFSIGIQDDNPWQVIPTAWVDAAIKRWTSIPPAPQSHVGVDVARGGNAETILTTRHYHWLAPLITFPGTATPDGYFVADQIEVAFANGQTEVRIDVLGVGSSPYDILNRRNEGIHPMLRRKIIPMSGGRASSLKDKSGRLGFVNQRSAWWWHMRELLDPANNSIIALPNDPKLIADLTAPRWRTVSRKSEDMIQVESKYDNSKEGLVKRLGRSPDRGDATVYAFAEVEPDEDEGNADWLDDL
jgi:hypothetical protein